MSSSPPVTSAQPQSDVAEVEAIARDYIEGWYTGDSERMARSLHAELVKRMPSMEEGAADGQLAVVSRAEMVQLTADGGGDAPGADVDILIDDVSTDIATARVVSPDYLDYLHLVKTPDGWKIANVLFHARGLTTPSAGKASEVGS